jgi:uncharacterized protein
MLGKGGFLDIVRSNEANRALLDILPELGAANCMLVAGCLFQTVWNHRSGRASDWGIKDYDIAYFDQNDLSWEAEDAVIRRCDALTAPLGIRAEVRNQARVHLWYGEKFGTDYPALGSAEEGLDRYLIRCTKVGIRVADRSVYAPEGFGTLWEGVLERNWNNRPELFLRKARDYQARWDWLSIVDPLAG